MLVASSSCLIGIQNLGRSCSKANLNYQIDEDELVVGSSIKGSSECSYASSSATDEEGFGTGVPG
ncbi:hypothetical protein U1Q18_002067, partial [Sarracenia purpurea var. burkii]